MIVKLAEADLGGLAEHAEFRPSAARRCFLGRRHDGAERQGAGLEAHSPHVAALDNGYGRSKPASCLSYGKTGRSRADDA